MDRTGGENDFALDLQYRKLSAGVYESRQFRGVTYLDSVAFGRVCPNERDTRRDDVSILVLLTGPVDTGNLSSSNDLELLCNSNYRDNLEVSTESLSKQSRKTSTTHGSQSK